MRKIGSLTLVESVESCNSARTEFMQKLEEAKHEEQRIKAEADAKSTVAKAKLAVAKLAIATAREAQIDAKEAQVRKQNAAAREAAFQAQLSVATKKEAESIHAAKLAEERRKTKLKDDADNTIKEDERTKIQHTREKDSRTVSGTPHRDRDRRQRRSPRHDSSYSPSRSRPLFGGRCFGRKHYERSRGRRRLRENDNHDDRPGRRTDSRARRCSKDKHHDRSRTRSVRLRDNSDDGPAHKGKQEPPRAKHNDDGRGWPGVPDHSPSPSVAGSQCTRPPPSPPWPPPPDREKDTKDDMGMSIWCGTKIDVVQAKEYEATWHIQVTVSGADIELLKEPKNEQRLRSKVESAIFDHVEQFKWRPPLHRRRQK